MILTEKSFTCDLVHVQDQSGEVADHENSDDQHQDDRHVVVLPASTSHPPPEAKSLLRQRQTDQDVQHVDVLKAPES